MSFPYKYYTYIFCGCLIGSGSCDVIVEYGSDSKRKPDPITVAIIDSTPKAPLKVDTFVVDTVNSLHSGRSDLDTIASEGPADTINLMNSLEQKLIANQLVNIHEYDESILVDLKYSSEDNVLGADLYGGLKAAYLLPEAAEKLAAAQKILKNKDSRFSLIIYDATRPQEVQYKMWELVKGTENEKYLAHPENGSLHNYGAAVDVSYCLDGIAVDMGTVFDHFGEEAETRHHEKMLLENRLTKEQINNREFLKSVMKEAGFFPILTEWWHFNAYARKYVRDNYKIIQ